MIDDHELLMRMDERLEFIQEKVTAFCAFKDAASIEISKCQGLPDRVTSLEKWRWGITGAFTLLVMLIGWGWMTIGGPR